MWLLGEERRFGRGQRVEAELSRWQCIPLVDVSSVSALEQQIGRGRQGVEGRERGHAEIYHHQCSADTWVQTHFYMEKSFPPYEGDKQPGKLSHTFYPPPSFSLPFSGISAQQELSVPCNFSENEWKGNPRGPAGASPHTSVLTLRKQETKKWLLPRRRLTVRHVLLSECEQCHIFWQPKGESKGVTLIAPWQPGLHFFDAQSSVTESFLLDWIATKIDLCYWFMAGGNCIW